MDTKTARIYQMIKREILSGKIKPGEKLVAAHLAVDFGVSVIPIREAFNQLKAEGFLEVTPHIGAHVKRIDLNYLLKIYPIRGLLEGYAAELACPFLNEADFLKLESIIQKISKMIEKQKYSSLSGLNYDFHILIYQASGNEPLVKIIEDLMDNTNWVRLAYDLMPDRALSSNIEHRQILNVLKKGTREEVVTEVKRHIEGTLEILIKAVTK